MNETPVTLEIANAEAIDELMNRDPLKCSDDDVKAIAEFLREKYKNFLAEESAAQKSDGKKRISRKKLSSTEIDLSKLDIKIDL